MQGRSTTTSMANKGQTYLISLLVILGALNIAACRETVLTCDISGELSLPTDMDVDAKKTLLCLHNQIRSQVALGEYALPGGGNHPVATNMQRLSWDENLAAVAASWAAQCNWSHNPNRTAEYQLLAGGSDSVGENLFTSTVNPPQLSYLFGDKDYGLAGGVLGWSQEGDYWHFGSIGGTEVCDTPPCGHFTQNIWASTTRVGCAYQYCQDGMDFNSDFKTFLVCNYATSGNYVTQEPYKTGSVIEDVCTEDMDENDLCINGLITSKYYNDNL